MKTNDIVKYAKPEAGEADYRFGVLEVNGDRVKIVLLACEYLPIAPVETLRVSDLEIVKEFTP